MGKDFFPDDEVEAAAWATNFGRRILVEYAALGLSLAQCESFEATRLAYLAAYRTAKEPGTGTRLATLRKTEALRAMEAEARVLAGIVRANPNVSDAQRAELRLPPRRGRAAPVAAPTSAPALHVRSVSGQTVTLEIRDADAPGRARPAGASNAVILRAVGEQTPADASAWAFAAVTSRTTARLTFEAAIPGGTKVWLVAAWQNARGQRSPFSTPVCTHLLGGVSIDRAGLAA